MRTPPHFTDMHAAATAKRGMVDDVLAGHARHNVQQTAPSRRKLGA
jgi:hypothetical protein